MEASVITTLGRSAHHYRWSTWNGKCLFTWNWEADLSELDWAVLFPFSLSHLTCWNKQPRRAWCPRTRVRIFMNHYSGYWSHYSRNHEVSSSFWRWMLDFELALGMITTGSINTTGTCVITRCDIHSQQRQGNLSQTESTRAGRGHEEEMTGVTALPSQEQIRIHHQFLWKLDYFSVWQIFPCMVIAIFCQLPAEVTILMQSSLSPLPWLHLPACTVSSGSSRNKFLGVCSSTPSSKKPWLKSTITVWWIPLP